MVSICLLFLYTMAVVMGRAHVGDGAEAPHFPGGRGAGQHEQDAVPYRRVRGKAKNIKLKREILNNKGKPIDMDYDRDMTYDPVGEPKDMFAHEIGKIMWRMVPFDKWTWKKFPREKGYNITTFRGKLYI